MPHPPITTTNPLKPPSNSMKLSDMVAGELKDEKQGVKMGVSNVACDNGKVSITQPTQKKKMLSIHSDYLCFLKKDFKSGFANR